MDNNYSISCENNSVYIRFLKSPSPEEFRRATEELSKVKNNEFRLWDLSCGINWSTRQMEEVTKFAENNFNVPSSKIAIVAPDDVTFGLFRLHGTHRETLDHQQNVFRRLEDAEQWLADQQLAVLYNISQN